MAFQFLNCCICCLYYRNSQFKTIHIPQTQLVLSQARARTHTHTYTHRHSLLLPFLSLSGTDTHACTRSITHAHTVYTRHVSVSLWSSFSNTPKGWRPYLQGPATPFKPWTCTFLYIYIIIGPWFKGLPAADVRSDRLSVLHTTSANRLHL